MTPLEEALSIVNTELEKGYVRGWLTVNPPNQAEFLEEIRSLYPDKRFSFSRNGLGQARLDYKDNFIADIEYWET